MIASGIDALIYIPYDSAGAQTVLQTCKDAGVKVINIDNVITEDDYELVDGIIASDNTQLGYLSGQWVAEKSFRMEQMYWLFICRLQNPVLLM